MNPTNPSGRVHTTGEQTAFHLIRYDPVAEIGSGGMGSVALARAVSGPCAGQYVALKRLFPHMEKEPHLVDAFFDEVWLISSLHHPNVVEPLDWGRDEEGGFLAMHFVPGDSLRALVRAREMMQSPLPIEVAIEVVARAAEGLHAAHELKNDRGDELNLVHRDVSPANVLVGYDGSVKLIDFGVAKAAGKLVHTQSGLIKGKYGYMSPEQIRGLPLDRRSDVFSLGVVLWEALTLCRLYSAVNEFEVMRLVCEEDTVPPGDIRGDVPAELDRVVLRCLAKSREDRYPSCEALAKDLRRLGLTSPNAVALIAETARTSMPERLRWIEQVTGQNVPVGESPLKILADQTDRMRSAPPTPSTAIPAPVPTHIAAPPASSLAPVAGPVVRPPPPASIAPRAGAGAGATAHGSAHAASNGTGASGAKGVRALLAHPRIVALGRMAREPAVVRITALFAVALVSALVGVWMGSR